MYPNDRKLYSDKNKLIEIELENVKKIMSERLDKLPNNELPFMEPHLRALYFETYFLIAKGFNNASLVLMGILLENIIKEKLIKGVKPELVSSKEFRPVSQIAKSEKEKLQVIDEFLEVDKFVRNFAEKYFKPKGI